MPVRLPIEELIKILREGSLDHIRPGDPGYDELALAQDKEFFSQPLKRIEAPLVRFGVPYFPQATLDLSKRCEV